MDSNPYESPKQTALPPSERTRSDALHLRLIRGMARGALIGATFGTIGGVAILLLLGFLIRTPVLTGGVASATKAILVFMTYSVVSTTTVGAIGFGLTSLPSRRPTSLPP